MKSFDVIKSDSSLRNIQPYYGGIVGEIHIGGWDGTFVCTNNLGWEHVSVCPFAKRITPSWDDMCKVKDIFFEEDEAVIQIHPAKKDYVNNMSNCLHIWKCTYTDMVLPPSCLVGIRKGQTADDLEREIDEYCKKIGERIM